MDRQKLHSMITALAMFSCFYSFSSDQLHTIQETLNSTKAKLDHAQRTTQTAREILHEKAKMRSFWSDLTHGPIPNSSSNPLTNNHRQNQLNAAERDLKEAEKKYTKAVQLEQKAQKNYDVAQFNFNRFIGITTFATDWIAATQQQNTRY